MTRAERFAAFCVCFVAGRIAVGGGFGVTVFRPEIVVCGLGICLVCGLVKVQQTFGQQLLPLGLTLLGVVLALALPTVDEDIDAHNGEDDADDDIPEGAAFFVLDRFADEVIPQVNQIGREHAPQGEHRLGAGLLLFLLALFRLLGRHGGFVFVMLHDVSPPLAPSGLAALAE